MPASQLPAVNDYIHLHSIQDNGRIAIETYFVNIFNFVKSLFSKVYVEFFMNSDL